MADGRARVRMSDAEVRGFLQAHRKVQVATLGRDGSPHLSALFYALDDQGLVCFWTYAASQKARNLERDSRVACLVESGEEYFELRGVSVRGRAELVRDVDEVRRLGRAVAVRMLGGEPLDEAGEVEVDRQAAKRVAVRVHAAQVASWDHAKLLR